MIYNNTICASATGSCAGAIAVIRLSGSNSLQIADNIFFSKNKSKKLFNQKPNTIHFGVIKEKDKIIDEVLISIFKAPYSYTGENSVEISCHGSVFIQKKIIELLIKNGAKTARPGEFTQRAFLNGKIDLSQAEAVADLISSKSEVSHRIAIRQMRGGFSSELKKLRSDLLSFISLIELELDFGEEDLEFADRYELEKLIFKIKNHTENLVKSFKLGNVIKNGIPVAIVGEPNVGKSTLLNTLLNDEKAIVSDIPGTTRDAVEDVVSIEGILFRFIDTAGIRKTSDIIENLGIERTMKKIENAEIVIFMLDANNPDYKKINDIYEKCKDKKLIIVINKTDISENKSSKKFDNLKDFELVKISAKYKINIEKLISVLLKSINYSSDNQDNTIITNVRHFEVLENAHKSIKRVTDGIKNNISGDFLAQDIREILNYIGEITGEFTTDEVLGNIFKNFCIGK